MVLLCTSGGFFILLYLVGHVKAEYQDVSASTSDLPDNEGSGSGDKYLGLKNSGPGAGNLSLHQQASGIRLVLNRIFSNREQALDGNQITVKWIEDVNLKCTAHGLAEKHHFGFSCIRIRNYTVMYAKIKNDVATMRFNAIEKHHHMNCTCAILHVLEFKAKRTVSFLVIDSLFTVIKSEQYPVKNVRLSCITLAFPPDHYLMPLRFLHTYHGTILRSVTGHLITKQKMVSIISSYRYSDYGEYKCTAFNANYKTEGSVSIDLDLIPAPLTPEEKSDVIEVFPGRDLMCCKRLHPIPEFDITYNWTDPYGKAILTTQHYVTVDILLHSIKIRTPTIEICFEISRSGYVALGIYILNVCNIKGCNRFQTTVKEGKNTDVTSTPKRQTSESSTSYIVVAVLLVGGMLVTALICFMLKRRRIEEASDEKKELHKDKKEEDERQYDNALSPLT